MWRKILFTVFASLLFLFDTRQGHAAIYWESPSCAFEVATAAPRLPSELQDRSVNILSLTDDFALMTLRRPMGDGVPDQIQVRGLTYGGLPDLEVKFRHDVGTGDVSFVALSPSGLRHAIGYEKNNRVVLRYTNDPSIFIASDEGDGNSEADGTLRLLFSPNERFLVALSQKKGALYKLPSHGNKPKDGKLPKLTEFEFKGISSGVQFSPDSLALLVSTREGSIYVMNLTDSEPKLEPILKTTALTPPTVGGCFASDPRYVLCGVYPDNRTTAPGSPMNSTQIRLWDRSEEKWLKERVPPLLWHDLARPQLRLVVPIPNTTKLFLAHARYDRATFNPDPPIDFIWDFVSGEKTDVRRREKVDHRYIFTSHAVATSDGHLFLGDATGEIRIIKVKDGSVLRRFRLKWEDSAGKQITQLHLHKRERYLVVETLDGSIRVITLPQR